MTRYILLALLCLGLGWGSLACAPKQLPPPQPTASGYSVSLRTAPDRIWMTPPILNSLVNYLGYGEIVVQVRDAQGRPVDDVVVEFAVEPAWGQSVFITPQRTLTHKGMARAIIKPDTTGIVQVMARVDNVTQKATFLVENQINGNGTASPGLQGLPYAPWDVASPEVRAQ